MSARRSSETKNTESNINERIGDFIHKYSKVFIIGFAALAVILAGFIIGSTVREKVSSKAMSELDGFNRRFEAIKPDIASSDPEAALKQVELIVLLEELSAFQSKNSGFAAARAYCLSAEICALQKRWVEAEEAWVKAAGAASKTYLAPLSFFNAAVAAEEQSNIDSAIAHYNSALVYGNTFPQAARAQFSVGRLEESRSNTDAAIAAYRAVLNRWPNDQVWPNLAQSRILAISE